jgi:hypothetical protein
MMEKSDDIKRLEGKMADFLDETMGRSKGMVKVAHPNAAMSNNSYKNYRSSFLTLGDMQIPDDYRKIFQWCRYFFKFDPIVGAAVRSLAVFPITDIIYNDSRESEEMDLGEENSESYKFYTNMFKDLDLYKHLIEIGYDYYLYGNCVIFAEPGVKTVRRRNKDTKEIEEKKEVVWKSLERLDITRLKIDRDPQTKEKIYYYDVPADIKKIIQTKRPLDKYNKIPEVFKKAVAKNGVVKLRSDFVFHIGMPAESGDSNFLATPPVLHAMKLILYSNILRQAQEAIAYEHIVPRRIYYFQETENFAPEYNFQQIADDFAFELRKQLNDPNYQVISPIPVQQIQHGGNGRALLLAPEIEQLENTILAAMGTPREFVFGGVSYSGSTTSLRILENNFITYRVLLHNYVNDFLIRKLAELRGEWEVPDDDDKLVKVEFSELKMQDDIQQKQLMITLNSSGKLPDEVLYEKVLGLDSRKIFKLMQNQRKREIEEQVELTILQAQAQSEMQATMAKMGILPPEPVPGDPNDPNAQGDPNVQGNPNAQPTATATPPASTGAPQTAGAGDSSKSPAGGAGQQMVTPQLTQASAMQTAQAMVGMSEAERSNVIRKLPTADSKLVMQYYVELQHRADQDAQQEINMDQMPTQLPPRRQGGV